MSPPAPPRSRRSFKVAVICALSLEAEKVRSVFDICWGDEGKQYEKVEGDQNTYTTGMIGKHNVVLAHMARMGSANASAVAAGLRSSFPAIQLAVVVGVCGVVPIHPKTQEEIVLGDIVISTSVVQYDFGRQYPNGFRRKISIEDNLGRVNSEIQSFINMLQMRQSRQRLTKNLASLLQSESFVDNVPDAIYPGTHRDKLYETSYTHRHRLDVGYEEYKSSRDIQFPSCDEVGCEDTNLILRNRHSRPKTRDLALYPENAPFGGPSPLLADLETVSGQSLLPGM